MSNNKADNLGRDTLLLYFYAYLAVPIYHYMCARINYFLEEVYAKELKFGQKKSTMYILSICNRMAKS